MLRNIVTDRRDYRFAGVVELEDTYDLGSYAKCMKVRVLSPAPAFMAGDASLTETVGMYLQDTQELNLSTQGGNALQLYVPVAQMVEHMTCWIGVIGQHISRAYALIRREFKPHIQHH